MSAKQTFAKLTEDLEQLEKSDKEKEVKVEEPKAPVSEPEAVEPVKEEPVVEEPVKEEEPKEEPKAEEPEVEPKVAPVVEPEAVEPVKEEPVVEPVAEEPKEEPKAEEEPVSKSEEDIETGDILKAFQAIHKSLGMLPSELAEIKATLASVVEVVNSLMKEEQVTKSETPAEEPTTEEVEVTEVEEEVVKSADQPEEEELDGKAVEFVSKSNGVPEIEGQEPQVEEEEVVPFNPKDHVDKMLRYYEEKSTELSEGAKDNIRSAVHRIKRGQPTGSDTKLAEQIYNFYGN
ncbi:hypothetical protein [Bacillus phage CM1]|nr:hypothetical protein [Bacillus phage CM1]